MFVAPFHVESFRDLVDVMGPSQVLFGSDWPHPEGTRTPRDVLIEDRTEAEVRLVVHDNTARLLGLRT